MLWTNFNLLIMLRQLPTDPNQPNADHYQADNLTPGDVLRVHALINTTIAGGANPAFTELGEQKQQELREVYAKVSENTGGTPESVSQSIQQFVNSLKQAIGNGAIAEASTRQEQIPEGYKPFSETPLVLFIGKKDQEENSQAQETSGGQSEAQAQEPQPQVGQEPQQPQTPTQNEPQQATPMQAANPNPFTPLTQ